MPQAATQSATTNPGNAKINTGPGVGSAIGVDANGPSTSSASSSAEGSDTLSDAQLAALAGMQVPAGVHGAGNVGVSGAQELAAEPGVDGEKIQAMMDGVTKELGMRDLSQLQLGGEMTLKLDQGALPNTEVKVRFDGDEMVISVDSQNANVNSFCNDNLALLQQSVASGMKEDMKVRVEIRNAPDQPNQQRQGGGSGSGSGGGAGSNSQGNGSGSGSGSSGQQQNSDESSLN
jgi:uncharacterized membrane protein YgcG